MTTYYINADTGNDSTGAGTSVSPWLTISKANTSASTGDTIFFQNSTASYSWTTQSNLKALILTGESYGGVILDGANSQTLWTFATGSHTWSNLIFQNKYSVGANPVFSMNATTAYTFSITNCTFKNVKLAATDAAGEGLFGNGTDDLGSSTFTFTGCLFQNIWQNVNGGTAVFNYRSNTPITATYTNCTFFFPIPANYTPNYLFMKINAAYTLTVKNCIIRNASGNTITWINSSSSMTQTVSNSTINNITSVPSGTNISTSDPLFIDENNGEFRLRPPSYNALGQAVSGTGSGGLGGGALP